MSVPHQAGDSPSTSAQTPPAHRSPPANWVIGLTLFAGIMMAITGLLHAMEGLVALFRNEIYVVGPRYIFAFDLTTWGWVHLIIGIGVAAAGFALMSGRLFGRVVGNAPGGAPALVRMLHASASSICACRLGPGGDIDHQGVEGPTPREGVEGELREPRSPGCRRRGSLGEIILIGM